MAENREKKSRRQRREGNPNWQGGRSVASNGYVLIKVGVDHHLADVRGYAYEHRLVAEQKAGRRIEPGEHVHHINGDKVDNRPENLEILTVAEHCKRHRNSDSDFVHEILSMGPHDREQIAEFMGITARKVGWILNRMLKRGQVFKTNMGTWFAFPDGGDPSEFPESLRIREFPKARA